MAGLQAGSPWPMRGYCPTRQGRSNAPRLPSSKPKWAATLPGPATTQPSIAADGTVYVGTENGKLVAVDAGGVVAWTLDLKGGVMRSTPAIAADGSLVLGAGLNVYGVSPGGEVTWTFPTGGVVEASPSIREDGTIVIASWDYSLYALTPDGKKVWAYATGNVIPSSPAIAPDGTIYVGSYDKLLHAVAADGSPVWTAPLGDYVGSTPAIAADGTVYIGSYDKSLYAIDKSGKKLGTYPTGQSVTYGPQIYGDTVFFYSDDLTLYALGKGNLLAWKSYLGNAMGAAALTFDGALVFPLASFTAPEIRCLTPGGDKVWSTPVTTTFVTQPAGAALGADGTAYVGYGATLYAFGPP